MLPYPPIEENEVQRTSKWFDIPRKEKIKIVERVSEVPVGKRFYFLDNENNLFLKTQPKSSHDDDYSWAICLTTSRSVGWCLENEDFYDTGIAFVLED